ncbi:MAG: nucleotidyl transferase AbiEii/AbiGii toxin family protein [Pseudobutyrivibrio sp.]|nr:nucleotidyl transferase AbiEii/AbiGii toxin family protein [Pseudobutyrivibrio sp.]
MDLRDEIDKIMDDGYNEANAEARLCQDILLKAISESSLKRNVTIKGGVVMRNLSGSARRATQDIDLDFIKYSISDESLRAFVGKLNGVEGLAIDIITPIIELNHQDYDGKRVFIGITDETGYTVEAKIDIGVHKDLDIEQEEYCFDICFQDDGASLLMNSREQIITEKVKSLLRFGITNTRYKDVFDIYFLKDSARIDVLNRCMNKYIFGDNTLKVKSAEDVYERLNGVFMNDEYINAVKRSKKNWLGVPVEKVLQENLRFFNDLCKSGI